MIERYFEKIKNLRKEKLRAIRKYTEQVDLLKSISGMNYKEVSVSGTPQHKDFADVFGEIELLERNVQEADEHYNIEYQNIQKDLNKLEIIEKEIIELVYIEEKQDKEILDILTKYYSINWSLRTLSRKKKEAKERFIKVIK